MVSFSCEVCNDTLKKPKLKGHFNKCPHAYFTCIDCNTTFSGNEFETHTTCITEVEKYQGKKGGKKQNPVQAATAVKANGSKVTKDTKQPKEKKSDKSKSESSKDQLTPLISQGESKDLYNVVKSLVKSNNSSKKEMLKKLQVVKNDKGELVLNFQE